MTDTAHVVLTEAKPLPEAARRHPLATRSGLIAFTEILLADQHWRPLTERQRTVLRRAYQAALHDAVAAGTELGTPVPLPPLVGPVHPRTAASLHRRGLVADGALTLLAVDVVRVATEYEQAKAARARPVEDVAVGGGVL